MRITPNFQDAFAQLIDGIYTVKIISVEGKTSQMGNKYLNWKLETVPERSLVYYSTVIEGKGAGMLKHFIRCVLDPEYENGQFDTEDFIGRTLTMQLKVKDIEGRNGSMKVYEVVNVWRLGEDPNSDIAF